ncbi:hypothetical protein BH11PSE11_BH11PSE11_38270 [soil metagenome]
MYPFRRILLAALSAMLLSGPAQASSVLPMNLDQIIDGAQIAFQGICTGSRSERDAQTGRIVTFTSFDVTDVLKGTVGATHTIKQVGGTVGGETYRVNGVPNFAVGQDYVVFLYGVSSAGFSSPVGLQQGKFVVTPGPSGPEISNGRDFKEMLPVQAGLPQAAAVKIQQAQGELTHFPLTDFKQIVRRPKGDAK